MNSHIRSPRRWSAAVLVAVLAAGAGAWLWHPGAAGQEAPRRAGEASPIEHAKGLSLAFRKAAEATLPTVVTVHSKARPKVTRRTEGGQRPRGRNPLEGTPFEDFFRDMDPDLRQFHDFDSPQPAQGVGSGVIIDPAGVVLTNNHVVQGADVVEIHLADGRVFKAEDVRRDEKTDLAVLKIKGAGTLPAARLGDSDKLEIGDWVIAVGAPFELEQTVSAGIISGKGRNLVGQRASFLQTDAAINPGNSGGPLVNLEGEVVGINSAIATRTGSFAGIGFAIPVNLIKWVVPQLRDKGTVQRAYLGVVLAPVDQDLAEQLGTRPGEGVMVQDVAGDSPAAKAGLQQFDVIKAFDGRKVNGPRELQEAVERVPLGSKHSMDLLRDGKTKTVDIVVEALPEEFEKKFAAVRPGREAPEETEESYQAKELGLEVSNLSAEVTKQLNHQGVVVTDVERGGLADEKGLTEGMVITGVGRSSVHNVKEFAKALKGQSTAKGVMLVIRLRGTSQVVVLKE